MIQHFQKVFAHGSGNSIYKVLLEGKKWANIHENQKDCVNNP